MRIALFICALMTAGSLNAQSPPVPAPPQGDASSYILLDYHSGRILAENNPDKPVEPASLTKMMTIYVAGEELDAGHIEMDDQVRVSEKAWRMGGSRMFIEVDTRVSVEDLLKGIIIQSGNDASVALAEHISGSEDVFAQLMNQAADRLGMDDSHFENSTGLPEPDHITTARDMAILAKALIRDHPQLYGMHAIREFTYNDITQPNRNQLLWRDESVDGIKTGHTENAGYCLVASAERDDMRLISVVMDSGSVSSRTSFSQSLLEYGFRFYETSKIAGAGEKIGSARVWKGLKENLNYGTSEDIYVTVPRGESDDLVKQEKIKNPLIAPVHGQQVIGTITVSSKQTKLVEHPLVSLEAIEEAGFIRRTLDSLWLMLE